MNTENSVNIKSLIADWVARDGKHVVLATLISRRISTSTAEKLVRNAYTKNPRGTIRTILEDELSKAGLLAG